MPVTHLQEDYTMASEATAGLETQVNTYTTDRQYNSTVTALTDGGWLVSWQSRGEDGHGFGIYQQRYDAHGAAVGDETRVNSYRASNQVSSAATALADGGWVVTWQSLGQDGDFYGIYQQRYDSHGAKVEAETRVNTYTASYQYNSTVTALADGGWVVSWTSYAQGGSGIYQQRYDSAGAAIGVETGVNTAVFSDEEVPAIAALADGGWVVSWSSDIQDGSYNDVYQQRYNSHGDAVGDETRVNSYTTTDQVSSAVTALADGGWLVSWMSDSQDGDNYGVYQQRYDSAGGAVGAETRVNTYTAHAQYYPTVTALADGGWLVCWISLGQDGSYHGIYQQRYDSSGGAIGSETRVNDYTTSSQIDATVTATADGGWVVSWSSYGQDGSDYGVYQRHFATDVRGSGLADHLTGTFWDETLIGFAGNDRLDGKGGNDILIGGYGNDNYVVNSSGDQVQELVNQGTDKVLSSVNFSLTGIANVENLTLTGKKNIDATGNDVANILIGNSRANNLIGLGGKDVLDGGKGDDMLSGGALSDRFVFKTGYGHDTISDFDAKTADHDRLELSGVMGIDSFAGIKTHMAQLGSAVVIDAGHGDSVTLEHVKLKTLDAGDFIF
jgi:Ca2+-binding RTX toxin-like protein